jgi:hypothetical protein
LSIRAILEDSMTLLARLSRNVAARAAMAFALGAAALFMAPAAEARITRIVIDPALSQSPTFEGRVFGPDGSVGTYEKLRGKAYGGNRPAERADHRLNWRRARAAVESDGHLHPEAERRGEGQPQTLSRFQQPR